MQKRILFFFILFFSIGHLFAQKTLKPCGSVAKKSQWLKQYQASPHLYQKNVDTILYVPLTIHLVGNEEGVGFFNYTSLLDALCTLNLDFEGTNIQFYIEGEVNYLYNASWYSHSSILEGGEMMFTNNVENTLNCYFVSDPAGNCGYNLPYAGIALAKSCLKPADHTWSHEVGHAFSLPHPFLGWEGGIGYDGSPLMSFSSPAPETVLYDYTLFQDTLILDTLIIDTAYVELVDGSNCNIAADGFCDTSPDYLAFRWDCNINLESPTVQIDPNGEEFRSDATLIMSYASDDCAYLFSDEQIGAMRANLYDEKPHLLYNQNTEEPINEVSTLIYPLAAEEVQYDNVELSWEVVPNATHYVVQISFLSSFSQALTTSYPSNQNDVVISNLLNDKNYYWRVRAFNNHNFCSEFSSHEKFHTQNMVAVNDIKDLSDISTYPTLLKAGNSIQIMAFANDNLRGKIQLFNSVGMLITSEQLSFSTGENKFLFTTQATLPTGVYFLTLYIKGQMATERIVIE